MLTEPEIKAGNLKLYQIHQKYQNDKEYYVLVG